LATPHQRGVGYDEGAGCSSPEMGKSGIHFAFVVSGKNKGLNSKWISLRQRVECHQAFDQRTHLIQRNHIGAI